MKMAILAVAAATSLASCVTAENAPPSEPMQPARLTAAQVKTIHDAIRQDLKDPASAIFGDMNALQDSRGLITLCGRVNAKNSFGGFTGMALYKGQLTTSGRFYLDLGPSTNGSAADIVHASCAKIGLIV